MRTGWHWGLNITAIFYTSETITTIFVEYCIDGVLTGSVDGTASEPTFKEKEARFTKVTLHIYICFAHTKV